MEFLLLPFYEVRMAMGHGEGIGNLGDFPRSFESAQKENESSWKRKKKGESERVRWHLTDTRSLLCRSPGAEARRTRRALVVRAKGEVPPGALGMVPSSLSLPASALSILVRLGA